MLKDEDGFARIVLGCLTKLSIKPLGFSWEGLAVVVLGNADKMIAVNDNVGVNVFVDELLVFFIADRSVVVTVGYKLVVAHNGQKLSFVLDICVDDFVKLTVFLGKSSVGKVACNENCVEPVVVTALGIAICVLEQRRKFCCSVFVVCAVKVNVAANGKTQYRSEIFGSFGKLLINTSEKR